MENFPLFEETRFAELIAQEMFVSAYIKHYDVLAFQIMPEHIHLLVHIESTDRPIILCDRTLESVRLGVIDYGLSSPTERTFSKVRSAKKIQHNISDLMQSIKGNFSRKLHMGNIWQIRFYTRIVTTGKYLRTVIEYIQHNPVKAELPDKYHRLPYRYFTELKIKDLF